MENLCFGIQLKESFKNMQSRVHCSCLKERYQFFETALSNIHQICLKVRFFRFFILVGKLSIYIGAIR